MSETIYTIGHSTHSVKDFIGLLRRHGVTAVGDVRSSPYSRANPQFNRESLRQELKDARISYVFLGTELGARSNDPECYDGARVSYERLARTEKFLSGLARVREGARMFRLALMCAEKEPLDCHRTILVSRHVIDMGFPVQHILADGTLESQNQAVSRLVKQLRLPENDMFRSAEEVQEEAYILQGKRIAYESPKHIVRSGAEAKGGA